MHGTVYTTTDNTAYSAVILCTAEKLDHEKQPVSIITCISLYLDTQRLH